MKKYLIYFLICFWLIGISGLAGLQAQAVDTDIELWSYMLRQSQTWYENMMAQYGTVPPGDWQVPIESAFMRLAMFSGEKGFQIQYAVLNAEMFNAAAFPGGQFVIFKGTLSIFDMIIEQQTGKPLKKIPAEQLAAMREGMLAPILAHELGHYYNRHSFKAMKKSWNLVEGPKEKLDLGMIQYTQENEFDADKTSYLLLQKSGYNPDLMLGILEILNAMQQDQLKGVPSSAYIVYLQTHPSPHMRLAQFKGQNQKWHAWAAELEKAFSDIALGTKLDQAVKTIDAGLALAPGNIYLIKARAVAIHKQWLATVSLKDQKLRGVIDLPTFRDEMLYSERGTRGTKKVIPGDKVLYAKAYEAYKIVYQQSVDPGFYSNFALLLAYSINANDMKLSLDLAAQACNLQPNYSNFSNLGVVYFLLDRKEEALKLLGEIAADYHKNYSAFLGSANVDAQVYQSLLNMRQQLKLTQTLSSDFVYGDFTPVLNYALALALMDQMDNAKIVAGDYLNSYEAGSSWAKHLASQTGVPLPKETEKKFLPVNGIKIGSNLKQVLQAWGKATEVSTFATGEELWYYDAVKTKLYVRDGVIYCIELLGTESPKVDNKFGVGSPRNAIEKLFGIHKRMANQFLIYEGKQDMAVLYSNDVAVSVVLY